VGHAVNMIVDFEDAGKLAMDAFHREGALMRCCQNSDDC
jgi:hypothetical protein